MGLTRRTFLKAGTAGGAVALGFDLHEARAEMREFKISRTTETRSTCPYCSVSCGVIIHTLGDKAKNATASVVHVEGDPDHPINRGTLCPKGHHAQGGHPARPPAHEADGAAPGVRQVGGHLLGRRDRRHREARQDDARQELRREEREGPDRQPEPGHRP